MPPWGIVWRGTLPPLLSGISRVFGRFTRNLFQATKNRTCRISKRPRPGSARSWRSSDARRAAKKEDQASASGNDGDLSLRPGRVLGCQKKKKKKPTAPAQCSIAGPENRLAEMNIRRAQERRWLRGRERERARKKKTISDIEKNTERSRPAPREPSA